MSVSIEQRVEDLLRHADVWEETKETLRDLLSEHKAGTLDPDDAKYIEGLHAKMFGERKAASAGGAKPAQNRVRDMAAVKPANDDVMPGSARRGLSGADLIQALRQDVARLVVPADIAERPQDEQDLRNEVLAALAAKLDEIDATKES